MVNILRMIHLNCRFYRSQQINSRNLIWPSPYASHQPDASGKLKGTKVEESAFSSTVQGEHPGGACQPEGRSLFITVRGQCCTGLQFPLNRAGSCTHIFRSFPKLGSSLEAHQPHGSRGRGIVWITRFFLDSRLHISAPFCSPATSADRGLTQTFPLSRQVKRQ